MTFFFFLNFFPLKVILLSLAILFSVGLLPFILMIFFPSCFLFSTLALYSLNCFPLNIWSINLFIYLFISLFLVISLYSSILFFLSYNYLERDLNFHVYFDLYFLLCLLFHSIIFFIHLNFLVFENSSFKNMNKIREKGKKIKNRKWL